MSEIPQTTCYNCGFVSSGHVSAFDNEKRIPVSGDLSMCLNCGVPAIFDDDLQLQAIDLDTMDLSKEERFWFEELMITQKDMKLKGMLDDIDKDKD